MAEPMTAIAGARVKSVTGRIPRGELIARQSGTEDGALLIGMAFEYAGRLERPSGVLRVFLPAEGLEASALILTDADGAETSLPFAYEVLNQKRFIAFDIDFSLMTAPDQPLTTVFIRLILAKA